MALLSVQQLGTTGAAVTYAAVAASDTVDISSGRVILHVKNAGGSADTVTIVTPGTVDGNAIADKTVSVPATTGERFIGPLNPAIYADSTGIATITHSFTTSVTVAAVSA